MRGRSLILSVFALVSAWAGIAVAETLSVRPDIGSPLEIARFHEGMVLEGLGALYPGNENASVPGGIVTFGGTNDTWPPLFRLGLVAEESGPFTVYPFSVQFDDDTGEVLFRNANGVIFHSVAPAYAAATDWFRLRLGLPPFGPVPAYRELSHLVSEWVLVHEDDTDNYAESLRPMRFRSPRRMRQRLLGATAELPLRFTDFGITNSVPPGYVFSFAWSGDAVATNDVLDLYGAVSLTTNDWHLLASVVASNADSCVLTLSETNFPWYVPPVNCPREGCSCPCCCPVVTTNYFGSAFDPDATNATMTVVTNATCDCPGGAPTGFFRLFLRRDSDSDDLLDAEETLLYGTDPTQTDSDGDGLPDGREIAIGTDPRKADTDGDGIPDGLDADPLSRNIPMPICSKPGISAVRLLPEFVFTNLTVGTILYERTFPIVPHDGWRQYFVSASTNEAAGASCSGLQIEWEDSRGYSGILDWPQSNDSIRVPIEGNPNGLTIRVQATSAMAALGTPIYLLAYTPSVVFDLPSISFENGATLSAGVIPSSIGYVISRSNRPCLEELTESESAARPHGLPVTTFGGQYVTQYEPYDIGGWLENIHAGIYRIDRILPESGSDNIPETDWLVVSAPSLTFGTGHAAPSSGLVWNPETDTYAKESRWPLREPSLWKSFHSLSNGAFNCDCTPAFSPGIPAEAQVHFATNLVVAGETATASLLLGEDSVWTETAEHFVYPPAWGQSRPDLLSYDECDACSSCENGNCDGMEGDRLGSLEFRIPLGAPRQGQISGFLSFRRNRSFVPGIQTLELLTRSDSSTVEFATNGVRTIVCSDERGRTVSIVPVQRGFKAIVTKTASGALEHTWFVTNRSSTVYLTKVSSLGNRMSDAAYTFSGDTVSRYDAIAKTTETISSRTENGQFVEERTLTDSSGIELRHTISRSERMGEGFHAVLREVSFEEQSFSNRWDQSSAYYSENVFDPQHLGYPYLVYGTTRPWQYYDYDDRGRCTQRIEQLDGSDLASAGSVWERTVDTPPSGMVATATFFGYVPHPGDSEDPADEDRVRTESRYEIRDGRSVLVGRTWYKYAHGLRNGLKTIAVTTIRACSQAATIDDPGNAVSTECSYDADDPAVPLLMGGESFLYTDEDGVSTHTAFSMTNGLLCVRTWKTTPQAPDGIPGVSTVDVSRRDPACGTIVRSATELLSGEELEWTERIFDDKNRLRATLRSNGATTTNDYSCCRLLFSVDETGSKTIRNAKTGQDHLYYGIIDDSLRLLPHWLNGYRSRIPYDIARESDRRLTEHFMDSLGREIKTTEFTVPDFLMMDMPYRENNIGWASTNTVSYPFGTDDYSIRIDKRGRTDKSWTIRTETNETTVCETFASPTDAAPVKTSIMEFVRNGAIRNREETADGWRETVSEYHLETNGCRNSVSATRTSDGIFITNSVTRYDFLGRIQTVWTPLSTVRHFYDGGSNRETSTFDETSGIAVTNVFNALLEPIGQIEKGVAQSDSVRYEFVSNAWWRIDESVSFAGAHTNSFQRMRTRLTGLSDDLRSETFFDDNGVSTHSWTSFDPTAKVETEWTRSNVHSDVCRKSMFGRTIERTDASGSTTESYECYGHSYHTQTKDSGSKDCFVCRYRIRNRFGDVEWELEPFSGTYEGNWTGFSYDSFGRLCETQDEYEHSVFREYDADGNLTDVHGADYPVRYGYDRLCRQTSLSTTRDGQSWDTTTWGLDPASGLCTNKTYADGTIVRYTQTPDGLPLRTTWARGSWFENAYDDCRRLSAVVRSDGSFVSYGYDAFGTMTGITNAVSSIRMDRSDSGFATNELQIVDGLDFALCREYDGSRRLIRIIGPESPLAMTYAYSANGLLAGASNALASVSYRYAGDLREAGHTVSLPNGTRITHAVTRNRNRRQLVTRITNEVDGASSVCLSYGYDALGRPTRRNDDTFGYNGRGEIVSANVSSSSGTYFYDQAGNRTGTLGLGDVGGYRPNALNEYARLSYDPDGNTLTNGAFSFTYDAENRLASVCSNGVLCLENEYDGLGRRVVKRTGDAETHFFYDGWNLVEERCVSGGSTNVFRYYWGKDISGTFQGSGGIGGLLFFTRNDDLFIPFCDANGNVVTVYDDSGAVAASFVYDAFGRTLAAIGPAAGAVHLRFSTKYYDPESELYYYGHRFYLPELGRWLNRDPLEESGGANLFLFCGNRPLNHVDPIGMFAVEFLAKSETKGTKVISTPQDIPIFGNARAGTNGELYEIPQGGVIPIFNSNRELCSVQIYPVIRLRNTLPFLTYMHRGAYIGYHPHSLPRMPSKCPGTPGALQNPFREVVIAHEYGHAQYFIDNGFSIIRQRLNTSLSSAKPNKANFAAYLQAVAKTIVNDPSYLTASSIASDSKTLQYFQKSGFSLLDIHEMPCVEDCPPNYQGKVVKYIWRKDF